MAAPFAEAYSLRSMVGVPWRGAYVATKFAMEGLTDVLRLEMQGTGIKVVLVEPGPITTAGTPPTTTDV